MSVNLSLLPPEKARPQAKWYIFSSLLASLVAVCVAFVTLASTPENAHASRPLPRQNGREVYTGSFGTIYYSRVTTPSTNADTLYSVLGDGSAETVITGGDWPRLSPDERYLAFLRSHGSTNYIYQHDIWIRDLTNGAETMLGTNNDYVVNYGFANDNANLLFDYECGIGKVKIDGSNLIFPYMQNATCTDDAPQIAPATAAMSGTIAFQDFNNGIGLANADGTDRRIIPNTIAKDMWPAWSPDGQWISFGYSPGASAGSSELYLKSYYKIHPDGTGLTLLASLSTACTDIFYNGGAWTPDGDYVLLAGTVGGVNGIYAVATDGSGTISRVPVPQGPRIDFVGAVTGSVTTEQVTIPVCGATPTSTAVATGTPITPVPTNTPVACGLAFADEPVGETYYIPVFCLVCRGIVNGYPCGQRPQDPCNGNNTPYFRTYENVTRAQIAKMASNSAGFEEDPGTQLYQDVPSNHTFYSFINRLSRRGFISGYPCGGPGEPCGLDNLPYFRPGASATRGQIAKIVSNTAGFSDPETSQTFQDVPLDNTFYLYVERLAQRGVINGYPCGGPGEPCGLGNLPYFRYSNLVLRGQAAKIISYVFFPACQQTLK